MGSIHPYTTKTGQRYMVRFTKPDGTQGSKSGFARKLDARLFIASIETNTAQGSFVDPQASRVRLSKLAERWLSVKQGTLKPSSYAPLEVA